VRYFSLLDGVSFVRRFFGSCLRGFSRVGPEGNCDCDVYLGKVLMREGNISEAMAQFEEALRLHPDFPEAEQNLRVAKGTSAQSR
jgi:tetratricopeptide (TPR) repeat protein